MPEVGATPTTPLVSINKTLPMEKLLCRNTILELSHSGIG